MKYNPVFRILYEYICVVSKRRKGRTIQTNTQYSNSYFGDQGTLQICDENLTSENAHPHADAISHMTPETTGHCTPARMGSGHICCLLRETDGLRGLWRFFVLLASLSHLISLHRAQATISMLLNELRKTIRTNQTVLLSERNLSAINSPYAISESLLWSFCFLTYPKRWYL